ncbi:MAG: DMT family transporter [Bacillota bacterium]
MKLLDTRILTYLFLVGAPITWGGSFVAGKAAVQEIPPFALAFIRFAASSLILVPWVLRKEGKKALPGRKHIPLLVFLGFTGAFLYNIFFLYGLKFNPAGESSLVIATNPILTTIAGALFLRERLTAIQGVALALAFLGAMITVTKASPSMLLSGGIGPHQLLLFGAPVCWAAFTVAGKKAMAHYSPVTSVAYTCVAGTLFFLPFAIPQIFGTPWARLSLVAWGSLVYLTILVTVLAFVWWYAGVERLGATRAAVFVNLVPISGMITAAVLLAEPLLPVHIVGAAMVIGGVILNQRAV